MHTQTNLMTPDDGQSIKIPMRTVRQCFRQQASGLLEQGAGGRLFFADDSLPGMTPLTKWTTGWRCQAAPRISVLLSGRHSFTFLRKRQAATVNLVPGDMCFFPPDAHDNEVFTSDCCYLGTTFLNNFTRFIIVTHETGPKGAKLCSHWSHWHVERPDEINTTLASLRATLRVECLKAGWHVARALWLLLNDWVQRTTVESMPLGKAHASWIAVDRFLQENYHRPLDRSVVAQTLGLHPNRISALCSEFGGKNFHTLLEEKRLRQAKRFLKDAEYKIETVAALCGYANAASFFRVFRQSTGMAPGEWRLQNKSGK